MSIKTLAKELLENGQLAELLKEIQALASYQICKDCKFKFEGKRKKKCPKCKSTNVGKFDVEETTKPEEEGIFKPNPKAKSTGKKAARKSKVDIDTKPYDSGEFKNETDEFTKKVKFRVSQRRPQYKPTKVKCSCGHTQEVAPILVRENWRCDECILRQHQ